MAHVQIGTDEVTIQLSPFDKVLALHGSLHLPFTHIQSVTDEPVPEAWFRGFRVGTNIPGIKTAGTFFTGDGTIFYDFHDPSRCLTFALGHEFYKRVIVEVDPEQNPPALVEAIRRTLTERGRDGA